MCVFAQPEPGNEILTGAVGAMRIEGSSNMLCSMNMALGEEAGLPH